MVVVLLALVKYNGKFHFGKSVLILLSLFGLLHLSGGVFHIGETRLYDYWFISGWFKFDNLVHSIGGGLAAVLAYNFLENRLVPKIRYNGFIFIFVIVTIASGLGAYNEILELIAVVFFNAGKAVGDYMNNALDLVFNLIGAFIAANIMYYHLYTYFGFADENECDVEIDVNEKTEINIKVEK